MTPGLHFAMDRPAMNVHGNADSRIDALAAGVALQNKTPPVFLLAGMVAGVLLAGPRQALRSRWPWLSALLALALWVPNLSGRWRTGSRSWSSRARSPPAAPVRPSRGTCSCPTSCCWSARCWCRCGWPDGGGRPHPWTDDRPTLSSTRRLARGAVLRQPEGDLADGVDTGVHVIDGLGQALPERAVRHGQCSVEP